MPNVSQPKRTGFAAIANAITARLVAKDVIPENLILWVARRAPQIPKFQGERQLLMRPRGFTVMIGPDAAGGRQTAEVIRVLDVFPRVRLARDTSDSDFLWLTDPAGYFALEEACIDALHNFVPEDSHGNLLVWQPIKLKLGIDPEKDQENQLWGNAALRFDCAYFLPMSLDEI